MLSYEQLFICMNILHNILSFLKKSREKFLRNPLKDIVWSRILYYNRNSSDPLSDVSAAYNQALHNQEVFMLTKEELPACPVATTVQLIGNKWRLLILRNLLERPYRFNELLKSLPGLSQKVLTDNLRFMEYSGIVTRTVYPEVPPKVEYALSDLGETMRPIINALGEWGINYQNLVNTDKL